MTAEIVVGTCSTWIPNVPAFGSETVWSDDAIPAGASPVGSLAEPLVMKRTWTLMFEGPTLPSMLRYSGILSRGALFPRVCNSLRGFSNSQRSPVKLDQSVRRKGIGVFGLQDVHVRVFGVFLDRNHVELLVTATVNHICRIEGCTLFPVTSEWARRRKA